ncbi:hypothetical protein EW146_g3079 [Bondarzewia mesenterica]|uniref:Mitotic checkpoint regulator, MAD2B-interacting-domain-containing protein n=1 Tax=Bondarzewia mesenterica TaxID=1095465 RepID=A0A4S4LYU7_9AGAM|nr:hypothetical protein EW146_g3079 [Bondarzewia mesenterica]
MLVEGYGSDSDSDNEVTQSNAQPNEADDEEDIRPPAKKARLDGGSGSSSLFSMLPAPKKKAPVVPTADRVLGGGKGPGLVFNAPRSHSVNMAATVEEVDDEESGSTVQSHPSAPTPTKPSPLPFLPPSLAKGKANISVEDNTLAMPRVIAKPPSSSPSVDFFTLVPDTSSKPTPSASAAKLTLPAVSSAPKVEEFAPPEPTPSDSYPGYYMLPSGNWAAYDPEYYKTFYDKWKADYDAHVRALEKNPAKGFEGAETSETQEVNAMREMEQAKREIQEREEKKSLTQGTGEQAAAPKMNVKGAKLGTRARSRHQLTTLLTEAYENREALEQRIAEGRRNRKEAGNKYGTPLVYFVRLCIFELTALGF